jgi:hypothetical protein
LLSLVIGRRVRTGDGGWWEHGREGSEALLKDFNLSFVVVVVICLTERKGAEEIDVSSCVYAQGTLLLR